MSNVILVVKVKVKEEFEEQVYTFMKALHKLTHELDEGCIQYDLHVDLEDKCSFTFVETWENEEALSLHEKKEHFISCVDFMEDKLESFSIDKLKKLEI